MNFSKNIFGSPPTKTFRINKELFGRNILDEHLETWTKKLIGDTEKMKAEATPQAGLLHSEAAALIFTATKQLDLTPYTKYLAVDIYQRFLLVHIELMYKYAKIEIEAGEDPTTYMSRLQQKVGRQAPLRIMTCLWIASKLTNHKTAVSRSDINEMLKKCGFSTSAKSINKSELRILEQLKFDCMYWITIPEYIGILVSLVCSPSEASKDAVHIDSLYETSLHVADYVALNHNKVYMKLFHAATGNKIVPEELNMIFAKVRSDRLLLAMSCITAANCILNNSDSQKIVVRLSLETQVPEDDVHAFTATIIKCLFGSALNDGILN